MKCWPHRLLPLLIAALALGAGAGCSSEAAPVNEEQAVEPSPVETLVLEGTEFVDTFQVLGTAEPRHTVQASSQVPGRILASYVEEGDEVREGQQLFRIDTEVDEAGLAALETNVEAAERELARLERLQQEGLATDQQVDNASTELEAAQKNLRQSQISVNRNVVTSPESGHVAVKLAETGEFANAGTPLVEIIDYETILIEAQVPESQIRHIERGVAVEVDIPALDQTVEGRVERLGLRSSTTTRTYTTEVHVDNPDLAIRPGMRARLHFERNRLDDVVIVPRDSILEGFEGREAVVVGGDDEEGPAQVRSVTTGPGTGSEVVILDGLSDGDRLVVRGHRSLIGDATVRVFQEEHQGDISDDSDRSDDGDHTDSDSTSGEDQ